VTWGVSSLHLSRRRSLASPTPANIRRAAPGLAIGSTQNCDSSSVPSGIRTEASAYVIASTEITHPQSHIKMSKKIVKEEIEKIMMKERFERSPPNGDQNKSPESGALDQLGHFTRN
jgi:hypothetical protein